MPGSAPVNVGDPELEYALYEAERRVRGIQAKLHRWAGDDPHRRFDDLYNLVCDPAFLMVAWVRVRGKPAYWPGGVRHRGNVSPTRLRSYGTGESVTRNRRPRRGSERECPLRLKPGGLSTVAGTQSD